MRSKRMVWFLEVSIVGLCALLSQAVSVARADNVYGGLRGTITDQTGAVVPGAKVTVTGTATGVSKQTVSQSDGSYEFPQLLAPADYDLSVEAAGFKNMQVSNIHITLNHIFVENVQLEVGQLVESVTVTEQTQSQVDTTSMQLAIAMNSTMIVDMPLNGRNYEDLMQLEPGVVAASDGRGGNGHGNYATNGSQADQNSYLINGTDNNDLTLNTVQINPSPDALAEFTMVTATINPEYARNSGAILNAVVKSGTNQFHGDGFEFFRDTSLNATNYFLLSPQVFHRNTFGGTIGGPIVKNKAFFFFSYQGTRESRAENTGDCGCSSPGVTPVYTASQRSGLFPDLATSTSVSAFPLVGQSGAIYPAGTPYSTIFPTGQIPAADINPVSANLLKFVPLPNSGANYVFNPVVNLSDNQYLGRIDYTVTAKDSIWGYFLLEHQPSTQTLPFIGATLPGFGQTNNEHWQQYTLAWNHTMSSNMLNELRVGYTRLNYLATEPETPTLPSSVGFTGINPQNASVAGLPVVNVTGLFDLGFSQDGPQPRIDQTYQVTDNFTKIVGTHSLKFGFEARIFQVWNPFYHQNSGFFAYAGAGTFTTGDAGADFLLGIPDSYSQASGDTANARTQEYYSYAQDQWKIRPNLTLTFGTGWQIDTPMEDISHDNHAGIAFRPGQQSTVFPTAPVGYVFQGDKGVNAFGTTKLDHFGPRLGFAYSPNWGGKLTGGPGKTSIRGGYGIYYNRFNEELATQTQGSPPFAITSLGAGDIGGSPSFAAPFSGYALSSGVVTPVSIPNKFPFTATANPNFSLFEPLSVSVYAPNITIPYAQNYTLTVQRQLTPSTVLSLGYVGAQGRKLLLTLEQNPGINPAGCAAIPSCVTNRLVQPVLFPQNYKYPGDIFASVGQVTTAGTSNYNAFQASVNKSLTHGLQFLASYTWSHTLDIASGFENSGFGGGGFGGFGQLRSTNPFNFHVDYASANYDTRQRLVLSYVYQIPGKNGNWWVSRLTKGWQVSGITTFQAGFPLDVVDSALPSLTDSAFQFYCTAGTACWDVPNVAGPVQYMNPRSTPTHNWFSATPNPFSAPAFGTQGDARRDILKGPGINNWDFAVMKDTAVTESTRLELRIEFFNGWNHTQFDPNGITTDFNNPTFGQEFSALSPRVIQLAGKFYF
jgi:hypothetical protein